jgi:hypothetical protein
MDLIPSERAVLKQIRVLFFEASERMYAVTMLRARWPAVHYAAYDEGYAGLIKKGLLAVSADEQRFKITNAGLRAMATGSAAPTRATA